MTAHRFTACSKCASPLAIRTWCEATEDGGVKILWRCAACATEFETVERDGDTSKNVKEAVDIFWPTLLVA